MQKTHSHNYAKFGTYSIQKSTGRNILTTKRYFNATVVRLSVTLQQTAIKNLDV